MEPGFQPVARPRGARTRSRIAPLTDNPARRPVGKIGRSTKGTKATESAAQAASFVSSVSFVDVH